MLLHTLAGAANPAHAQSTATIYAKALNNYECSSTEWHLVITQLTSTSQAPSSVQVTWANGSTLVLGLWKVSPPDPSKGTTAHYTTTANLTSSIIEARTTITTPWTGEFNVSHGPCATTPTRTPTITPAPSNTPTPEPTSTPKRTSTPTPVPTNTPTPVPTNTPVPTPTATPISYTTISGTGLESYTCDAYAQWIFVIDRLTSADQAPLSIQVTWDYGETATILLDRIVGDEAQYAAVGEIYGVTRMTAVIAQPWIGSFYIRQGYCQPIAVPTDSPELGSLSLFGSGALGLAGYAYARMRARRR